jgi:hypothetical protein
MPGKLMALNSAPSGTAQRNSISIMLDIVKIGQKHVNSLAVAMTHGWRKKVSF